MSCHVLVLGRVQDASDSLYHLLFLSFFCVGSMPGTLVCSSLRSRQAYWAAPSTTPCDALLPSPFTLLSLLLFRCRGLMLSMLSTSICDTAARSCLTKAQLSGLPRHCPLLVSVDSEAEAPGCSFVRSRLLYLRGESQREERGWLSLTEYVSPWIRNCYRIPILMDWKSPGLSPVGISSINYVHLIFVLFCILLL